MRRAPLILVAEDEVRLREPLAHLLKVRRFGVVTADSAERALAALRGEPLDAAIVDLNLKDGTGRDVIVRMPSAAPVIIFSGMRGASGELERLRPRTRFVEKPCSLTWLIDALDEMLARATPGGGPSSAC